GRLQGLLQPVDGETAKVAVQQLQVGEDAIGQLLGEGAEVTGNEAPVFGGAFLHGAEAGALFAHGVVSGSYRCPPMLHRRWCSKLSATRQCVASEADAPGEHRSEEHTSELQSRENLVC